MHRILPASSVVFTLFVLGCSSGPSTVPVSGHVTMDKAPLPGASITFKAADAAKGAQAIEGFAVTDDQGNYTLKLGGNFGDVRGVPAGKYRVNIDKIDREAKGGIKHLVPEKYNRESKLTFDVPPGGTTSANFDLTSK